MKRFTTVLLTLFLHFSCIAQTTKEEQFKVTLHQLVIAFSKQESKIVAKYIDQKVGIYQLDRIGVYDHYNHLKTITFSDTTYPNILFKKCKNVKFLTLKYAQLPTWDCDKGVWSKKGLFVDTTKKDHILSNICKQRKKYIPENIPNKLIRFFYDLENESRRVVLFDNNGIELVIYLSYLDGKWYLTMVDNVSSDCSA